MLGAGGFALALYSAGHVISSLLVDCQVPWEISRTTQHAT